MGRRILLALASFTSIVHAASITLRRDAAGLLTQSTMSQIQSNLLSSASKSWENGTMAQAMTEWLYPTLSILGNGSLYPGDSISPTDVIEIAQYTLRNKSPNTLPLCADGSAADPASLGQAVMLANATTQSSGSCSSCNYAQAAAEQVEFLLDVAPRTSDGAISHRVSETQLWADFVFMAPPFLSEYGAITQNQTIMQEAYDQCRLYRKYLLRSDGTWNHIVLGNNYTQDEKPWATGNAWAAAGMVRVIAAINKSAYASQMSTQKSNLIEWTNDLLISVFKMQDSNTGLLRNYLNDSNTFLDAASTTLLASASFRLYMLTGKSDSLNSADIARQAIFSNHIDNKGWLNPVVDPLSFGIVGSKSPEAQAFVIMLQAAYNTYLEQGGEANPSGNATVSSSSGNKINHSALAVVLQVILSLSTS